MQTIPISHLSIFSIEVKSKKMLKNLHLWSDGKILKLKSFALLQSL